MKAAFTPLLCCPKCKTDLRLEILRSEGDEILEGVLHCGSCHTLYPVVEGIPHMLPNSLLEAAGFCETHAAALARYDFKPDLREVRRFERLHKKTARAFGFEWNKYKVTSPEEDLLTLAVLTGFDPEIYKKIFFADIFTYIPTEHEVAQIDTSFLAGKTVIEMGCGMGKYVQTVSRYAALAIGLDLSHALLRARRNAAGRDNIFYVRGNILEPPFRPGTFDYGYSVGVLHHTPDCHEAFNRSVALIKDGGKFSVWLYPTERANSRYARITHFVQDDLLRPLTCRLPPAVLYQFCRLLGAMTFWRDGAARKGYDRLACFFGMFAVGAHSEREIAEFLNFDWYSPQYRTYHSEEELLAWYRDNHYAGTTILPMRTSAIAEKLPQEQALPPSPAATIKANLDYPAVDSCPTGGLLLVQGWAFEIGGRSPRIKVLVNGTCVQELQCFAPRVDVKKYFPDNLHALYCGFHHWLRIKRSWAPGFELAVGVEVEGAQPVTLFRKRLQAVKTPLRHILRKKIGAGPIGWVLKPLLRRYRARRSSRANPSPGGAGSDQPSPDHATYQQWLALYPDDERHSADASEAGPLFSILLPVHNTPRNFLLDLLKSISDQTYSNWQLCAVDDGSDTSEPLSLLRDFAARHPRVLIERLETSRGIAGASNAALRLATGDYVCFVDHDDVLNINAFATLAQTIRRHPDADVLYSDHDLLLPDGTRDDPRLKPSWSPELLLSFMYWGHLKTYRRQVVLDAGGLRPEFRGGEDYDLALRVSEHTDRIVHVPAVLYHWRRHPQSTASGGAQKDYSIQSGLKALQQHLDRRGVAAVVLQPEPFARAGVGMFKLNFRFDDHPKVSIVIPTRDRLTLLRKCIATLEQKTTYPNYEVIIVDNASRDKETLEYFRDSPHRVISCPLNDEFNFSALVNEGAEAARGDFLLLLNNDIEIIRADWLHELVGYARIAGVGAVGAKLLYPDRRIQHNGVILGHEALTGHYFQGEPSAGHDFGYLGYKAAVRNVTAVTGACLLTPRDLFKRMGGFDRINLKVAWNDVDYCLRLLREGYRIVINPHSVLIHHEGASRGDAKNEAEVFYMLHNWPEVIDNDPYYHPFFSRTGRNFRLRLDPNEEKGLYYYKYHQRLRDGLSAQERVAS